MEKTPAGTSVGVDDPYEHVEVCDFVTDDGRCRYAFEYAEQDPEFRHFFYRTVLPALRAQGTGILAMTHDERYFDVADRVLRLEDGQLSEVTADSGIARATALAGLVRGAQQPSVKRSPKSGQGQK